MEKAEFLIVSLVVVVMSIIVPRQSFADELVVTETGNVGIGIDNPQSILHVGRNANASSVLGQSPAALMLEQTNNENWSLGEAAAEIIFKKGNDIVGAIRSEHMRAGGLHSWEDAGLAFYVAPANSETPIAFEAMRIDHGGNVGIGTNSPQSMLHVAKNASASAVLGQAPAVLFLEQANNVNWSDGEAAAEIIFKKGDDIVGAIRSEHTRTGGPHSFEDAGLTFYVAPANSETPIAFEAMRIDHDGYVGIGTTNPQAELDVAGNILSNGTPLTSDIRWKENIQPIEDALERVNQLRGVKYEWIDQSRGEGLQLGVIAQEVEDVFPEVVYTDRQGYKSVEYAKLVAPLIEAVKELKTQNDTLQARNEQLENQLNQQKDDFEQRLAAIEARLQEK